VSVYELDISWATTAGERRRLHWELLACEKVRGVFLSASEDALTVLFSGRRRDFDGWTRKIEPDEVFIPGHDSSGQTLAFRSRGDMR
jgi:hypothetical protein